LRVSQVPGRTLSALFLSYVVRKDPKLELDTQVLFREFAKREGFAPENLLKMMEADEIWYIAQAAKKKA